MVIIITLFIIVAPPLPPLCTEENETRNEGDTVVLEHCPFTSPVQLSEVDFQWSIQNGNGEWTRITPGGRFSVNYDGFLIISNVQLSDSGLYQVNISNDQATVGCLCLHYTYRASATCLIVILHACALLVMERLSVKGGGSQLLNYM
jgi:hypothetical protein